MRIVLSCLGEVVALALALGCFAGIVAVVMSMPDSTAQPAPTTPDQPATPDAKPDCPDCPKPAPDKPKEPNKRKRWAADKGQPVGLVRQAGKRGVFDGPVHSGQEVQVDIPADILKRNIASKGLGCCVFRATEYQALNQNVPELFNLPEKMKADGIAGGGWPAKFDEIMKKYAPNVRYMQVQNGDWNIIKLALKTGRAPCITVMGGMHMVNLVAMQGGAAAYRDNNFTGPNEIWWMSESEAQQESVCSYTGGKFWAVILLAPRPPMPPRATAADLPRFVGGRALSAPHVEGDYSWKHALDPEQWLLWRNGLQVGSFVPEWDSYTTYLGPGKWGRSYRRPPVPLPSDALECMGAMPPGVRAEALLDRECYSICGQEVSREQAEAALVDDSDCLSLSAIGSAEETARVAADLDRPEFAAWKQRVVFQRYTPDNWAVSTKRYGFDTSGHPTVYLQKPDGTVLTHVNSYEGPATLQRLRKNDPNYKPADDPGMKPIAPLADSEWNAASVGLCLMGSGTFVLSLIGSALALLAHVLIPEPQQ